MPRFALHFASLAALLLPLMGCVYSNTRFPDPVLTMLDRQESNDKRWAAAKQAEAELPADPARIKALQRIVWERGYPVQWSNYAVDQLIAHDEAAARRFLGTALVLIQDPDTIEYVVNLAVTRNWTDMVPGLVRSYARPMSAVRDPDRLERAAIEKLAPDLPVEQTVLNVFASDSRASVEQRAAAWQLLYRLTHDRARMMKLLADCPANPQDGLLTDLQAAAADLSIVPVNFETITWVRMLRTPEYAGYWQAAQAAVQALGEEQRAGLEPRHLAIVLHAHRTDPSLLQRTRADLLGEVSRTLASQQHYTKGPTYDGPLEDHPQELAAWAPQLVWADLATIRLMSRLMQDRRVASQWFTQADADLAEDSTEYGGLVRLNAEGMPEAQMYRPIARVHNYKYLPPKQIVVDAYTALAHYHFHAQAEKNQRFAGPGVGDLDLAKRHRFPAIVLTFIDRDTLNVDYYQANDIVIDLGTIRR